MVQKQIAVFLVRWLISSAGMYLCINFFATLDAGVANNFWLYATAGLVFSIVNSIVRPLATLLSLPIIILSMGIFTLLINVAMMALTTWILPGVHMTFINAVWSTLLMSFINWFINLFVPTK